MDFKELVSIRQSCRSFDKNVKIDESVLVECAKTAMLSPSACNAQPYIVKLVNDEELLKKAVGCIQDAGMNRFADNASAMYVIFGNKGKLISTVTGKLIDSDFTQIDIGIFTAPLTLALAEKGIGSCIIGWINKDKLSKLLGVEKPVYLCVLVGAATEGYEIREKKRKYVFSVAEKKE